MSRDSSNDGRSRYRYLAAVVVSCTLALWILASCGIDGTTSYIADLREGANASTGDDAHRAARARHIASVQADASDEYAFHVGPSTEGFFATNDVQGFSVELAAGSLSLSQDGDAAPWTFGLTWTEMIRRDEGGLEVGRCFASPVAHNRLACDTGAGNQAWFINGPLGVQHGYTLGERVPGDGELVIALSVTGNLTPESAGDGSILLRHPTTGRAILRYSDLYVEDDRGVEVPARLRVAGATIALLIDDRGATYPLAIDPLIASEQQKLTASDAAANDQFGYSVAIEGDRALVGAWLDDDNGNNSGSVYVFELVGATWTQKQKLTGSDCTAGSQFGSDVALFGDTAVIGARGHLSQKGAAYVFLESGGVWSESQKLTASDGAASDVFGEAVALHEDTVVIGARSHDVTGAAYVFFRVGGVWGLQQKLSEASAEFGRSVSLQADTALIGAPSENGNVGASYVYTRSGATWSLEQKLTPNGGAAGDVFGLKVALDDDTAVIGAVGDDAPGFNGGAAYVYVRTAGVWSEQQKLLAGDGSAGDLFGSAVDVADDTAIVTAYGDDDSGTESGSAYFFNRTGSTWSQTQKVLASDGSAGDVFGWAIAMTPVSAIISAYTDAGESGSAYIYGLLRPVGEPCSSPAGCESGNCIDDVCCDTPCGGGLTTDCQACSIAAGAALDGTCGATTGSACDDGSACTQTDICQSGVCTGADLIICSALDACHEVGTCSPATGLCDNPPKPDGTTCSDGDPCTAADTCQSGACTSGSPVTCTPPDQCHDAGVCDPATGACSGPPKADGTLCDDGSFCNGSETCNTGVCGGSTGNPCAGPDGDDDCAESCNEDADACDADDFDGSACDDGDLCTQMDGCQAGICVGQAPVTCSAIDPCHEAGTCESATGLCSEPLKPNGATCNDTNSCTEADTCADGQCIGQEVVCTPSECQHAGVCTLDTGTCVFAALPDGTPCATGTCIDGLCSGGALPIDPGSQANPLDLEHGCGCHVVGTNPARQFPLWLGLFGLALRRRRRLATAHGATACLTHPPTTRSDHATETTIGLESDPRSSS